MNTSADQTSPLLSCWSPGHAPADSSTVSANSSTSQSYLAGSTLTITCDIDVPLSINTMINVIMEWTRDGSDIENSSRVSFTTATETSPSHYHTQLVFSTLSSSMDSSNYECSATINSNDSLLYVEDSTLVNESTTVSVQGMNMHAFMYVCFYMCCKSVFLHVCYRNDNHAHCGMHSSSCCHSYIYMLIFL